MFMPPSCGIGAGDDMERPGESRVGLTPVRCAADDQFVEAVVRNTVTATTNGRAPLDLDGDRSREHVRHVSIVAGRVESGHDDEVVVAHRSRATPTPRRS